MYPYEYTFESYPNDIERLWKLVEENPHIIGDFTWTGYDYIGEAGVGIFHYDGKENFTSIYPERLGYIGDIDLIGNRRPISYLREIIYGLTKKPYIAVERMEHAGETPSRTAWMFKDNLSSWTWNGFEGKEAVVDVYASADEVELFLNDRSLGKKKAGKEKHFTATYKVPYEPGELKAIAYEQGEAVGEYSILSANEVLHLCTKQVTTGEISYVKIWLEDENGILNPQVQKEIHCQVTGNGLLEGFGSANPSSEEDYFADTATTFDGYVMAAIRRVDVSVNECVTIEFSADGCESFIMQVK